MKTISEYEASDIRLGNKDKGEEADPVHGLLLGQFLIMALSGKELSKPNPDDPTDVLYGAKKLIADFLNHLEKAGYSIRPLTDVPAAFRE